MLDCRIALVLFFMPPTELSHFIVVVEHGAGNAQLRDAASPDESVHHFEDCGQDESMEITVRGHDTQDLGEALLRTDEKCGIDQAKRNGPEISGCRNLLTRSP